MYIYIYIYIYIHMSVYIYIYTYTYIHTHLTHLLLRRLQLCQCRFIYDIYIHICIYIHIHTMRPSSCDACDPEVPPVEIWSECIPSPPSSPPRAVYDGRWCVCVWEREWVWREWIQAQSDLPPQSRSTARLAAATCRVRSALDCPK